jgi:hypothetical protein
MSQEFYKEKYLKYKNKYISLKGGVNPDIEWLTYKPFSDYLPINNKDMILFLMHRKQKGIPSKSEFTTYIKENEITDWKEQLEKYNILVDLNPYSFIVLPNPPEIVIPPSIITFDYSTDVCKGSLLGKFEKRPDYNIPITHYLLSKDDKEDIFIGMYYHDSKNPNEENIEKIKKCLTNDLEKEIDWFKSKVEAEDDWQNNLIINGKFEEIRAKYLTEKKVDIVISLQKQKAELAKCITAQKLINSSEFWRVNRYFKINELKFIYKNKSNVKINCFNSVISERGSGHKLLFIWLYIFYIINRINVNIQLDAGSTAVVSKFYEKIGFNCEGDFCTSNLIKLLDNYNKELPDIKLILQYNNTNISDLKTMIDHFKELPDHFKELPDHFKELPDPPEIVIPPSIIRFDTFSDDSIDDYLNIYKYYANYGESEKIPYEINVTHYLLDFTMDFPEKSFIGMYYHDPNNSDEENKQKIINALVNIFNNRLTRLNERVKKYGIEEVGQEQLDEVNQKISKIQSKEFWSKGRYFKINELRFKLQRLTPPTPNYNYKLEIENLNSVLSTRGGGKTLVCLFFSLFFHNKGNLQSTKIELYAGSNSVVERFYKKKLGMDCTEFTCVSDVSKIISKCEFPSDIKLILQYNDSYLDNLETMISNMQ